MTRLVIAIAITSMFSACAEPDGQPNEGPDLDLPTAQVRATELGAFLQPLITAVGDQITAAQVAGMDTVEANNLALSEWFGSSVTSVTSADGQVIIDNAFQLGPATEESVDGAVAIDGRPVLLIWTLTGAPGFFYEPTVLDTRTGAVYQGFTDIGKRPMSVWMFFGPLIPPEAARVTGHFDSDGLWALYTSIRDGTFNAGGE